MSGLLPRLRAAHKAGKGVRLGAGDVASILAAFEDVNVPDSIGPDPCTPFRPEDVDLDDPIERAAIAMSLLTWNTPENVPGLFATSESMIRASWAGPETVDSVRWGSSERSWYRRRVVAVLRAYGGVA